MLSVPERSFVRFVDSGEGDEYLVDPVAVQDMIPNPAPWAERRRQEGVFYIEWPDVKAEIEAEQAASSGNTEDNAAATENALAPFIGLYINTNKTGIDGRGFQIRGVRTTSSPTSRD